jgi:hypothetical protein
MIPLQDIENETTNLTLETIEFGIPETFADPRTIDFDAIDDRKRALDRFHRRQLQRGTHWVRVSIASKRRISHGR